MSNREKEFKLKRLSLLTLSILSLTSSASTLEAGKRIMLEYQSSTLQNSVSLEDDNQGWTDKGHNALYGNFGFDLSVMDHTIRSNAFINHSQSKLYESRATTMDAITFPSIIVTRDLFKFEEKQVGEESKTQALLNQFEYTLGDEEIQFTMGRMWVKFGQGKFINPVNPFRSTTEFSNFYGIEQAVDGGKFLINRDKHLKLHIYIFGDKRFTDYDERLKRSAMIRGEWQKSENTKINYILGEDLERHKYGFEISHRMDRLMGYGQLMRYTKRIDLEENESQNLGHWVAGGEFKFNANFKFALEGGKLQRDRLQTENTEPSLSFLPIENFVFGKLFFNDSEQRFQGELAYVTDQDSGFSFHQFNLMYHFHKNMYLRYFFSTSGSAPEQVDDYTQQNNVAETLNGLALRALF